MGGHAAVLGAPRQKAILLKNGTTITIGELALTDTWEYCTGAPVDPDRLIRASVIDVTGAPAIAPDEKIPLAVGIELLPHILAFNGLESAGEDDDDAPDFPRAASNG